MNLAEITRHDIIELADRQNDYERDLIMNLLARAEKAEAALGELVLASIKPVWIGPVEVEEDDNERA